MKKILCLFIIALFLMTTTSVVFAAPDVAYDGTSVMLSGTVSGASDGDSVTVIVVKPDAQGNETELSEVLNANDTAAYLSLLEYAGIVTLGEDALFPVNYRITLKESLPSGPCGVYINFLGQNNLEKIGVFNHINAEELARLVEKFNAENADYSALLTEENLTMLASIGVDKAGYASLNDLANFHLLLKGFAPFKNGLPNADMSAALNFSSSFNHALALQELREAPDTFSVLSEYNKKYWDVSIGEDDDFTLLGETERNEILSVVKNQTHGEKVSKTFAQKTGISVLKSKVILKGDVEDFINNYKDAFGLNIELYNSTNLTDYDRADICTYILNNKAEKDTPEEILKLYEDALESINDDESGEGGSDSDDYGSGNSGGGSGGGSTYKPPVVKIETETKENAVALPFNDVPLNHWSYSYIDRLYKEKIVSGKSADSFKPSDRVKKEEFVKLVVEALDLPLTGNTSFDDVEDDMWYKPYVVAAVDAGLISGKGDGNFGIGDKLSRQDAAVILSRALESKINSTLSFSDKDEISAYAIDAIAAMASEGIITGYDDHTFKPKKEISRAESCAIICRLLDKKGVLN